MPISPVQFERLKANLTAKQAQKVSETSQPQGGPMTAAKNYLYDIGKGVSESVERVKETAQDVYAGKQAPTSLGLRTAGSAVDIAFQPIASLISGGVKGISDLVSNSKTIQKIATTSGVETALDAVAGAAGKYSEWKVQNPEDANNLEDAVKIALVAIGQKPAEEALATVTRETKAAISAGAGPLTRATKVGTEVAAEATQKAKTTLFGRPAQIKNVDDVIRQADESLKPAQILAKTEQATAKPSLLQRWAGISSDVKNRIAGKQEKLKEYFDVAHARNNLDTLPTPLEYGARNVDNAVTKMESVLNDTGSKIGTFRRKVSTYQATIDDVGAVEKSFNDQLSRLNLETRNGAVAKKPGTITRVNSDSEIKVLNDLYGELQIIKQAPSLERLIDFRNLFDSKINFAKSARDVSSSLDPVSRAVRKTVADVGAKIVGKSEAENLSKYADFMDAYNQLRSFTDRKAGAEFLLKQALSERGRVPRETMAIIKEFTGIDLMDDATMATIATDLIGNARQKGVFRQELTKAGLDVEATLSGKTSGAIQLMTNLLKKGLVNEEKQFLKAAK